MSFAYLSAALSAIFLLHSAFSVPSDENAFSQMDLDGGSDESSEELTTAYIIPPLHATALMTSSRQPFEIDEVRYPESVFPSQENQRINPSRPESFETMPYA